MKSKYCYDACTDVMYDMCKGAKTSCYQRRQMAEAWEDIKKALYNVWAPLLNPILKRFSWTAKYNIKEIKQNEKIKDNKE